MLIVRLRVIPIGYTQEEREQSRSGYAGFDDEHPHDAVGELRARREQELLADVALVGHVDHHELAFFVGPVGRELRHERGQVGRRAVHAGVDRRAHLGAGTGDTVVLGAPRAVESASPGIDGVPGVDALVPTRAAGGARPHVLRLVAIYESLRVRRI